MKRLLVFQHAPHEWLGSFEPAFTKAGCKLIVFDATDTQAAWPSLANVDAIVSIGGPQSVYEQKTYPYLAKEIALLRDAVKMDVPILGVCLGSQLLAAALGAEVRKNASKEIGWHPIMREPGADGDPLFEAFGQTEAVFQWHSDTFALPKGAVQLASSPLCEQQAFRYGERAYGLQFHVEITEALIRAWLIANKADLDALKGQIDPAAIKRQTPQHLPRMAELSRHVVEAFCRLIPLSDDETLAPKEVPDVERPLPVPIIPRQKRRR